MPKNIEKTCTSYQDVIDGKPFCCIDETTIPKKEYPQCPHDIHAWSSKADPDLLALASAIFNSALPSVVNHFYFPQEIGGIRALDLFSLNTLMGATIEDQVVNCLNRYRDTTWDKSGKWNDYMFVRSAQAFPDVRLVHNKNPHDIKIGIELKSWFILAKEGVPSMRFSPHPDACADLDMICVVPWYLSNAVCGIPTVTIPWVQQAKYAAKWSMFYWKFLRETDKPLTLDERGFDILPACSPYPVKSDQISLHPKKDGGKNYGRLPRYGNIMTDFCKSTLETDILGIPAESWRYFLQIHTENAAITSIKEKLLRKIGTDDFSRAERVLQYIYRILDEMPETLTR